MNDKRFELDMGFGIRDNLTGKRYSKLNEIVSLLNTVSDRADRNAELLDVDTVAYYKSVEKILAKYEIDSIEKLDLMLMQQRVW